MEEIIYSRNNNSTISCYSMDFSGISKQNAHSGRNVMPRCLSEGVDIFLKSVERQGESGHDVRVSRSAPWMARVGDPVILRTAISLFIRKFTPGDATLRRDVPFAMGVRGFFTNSQFNISSNRTAAGSRAWGRAPVFQPAYRTSARIWTGD